MTLLSVNLKQHEKRYCVNQNVQNAVTNNDMVFQADQEGQKHCVLQDVHNNMIINNMFSNADQRYKKCSVLQQVHNNSNSNWTFIALNLPKQEDSKAQQNKKQTSKFLYPGA